MRVIWRPAALTDRDNIINYICQTTQTQLLR
jgi:plasmid stabilization system protein ParE